MLRKLVLLDVIAFFCCLIYFSCTNAFDKDAHQATENNTTTTTSDAATGEDYVNISMDARAESACKCYKSFTDMRSALNQQYQAGDSTAFTDNDADLRQQRRAAVSCVKKYVEPVRSNAVQKDAFIQQLGKTCPSYSTSILLATQLTYQE